MKHSNIAKGVWLTFDNTMVPRIVFKENLESTLYAHLVNPNTEFNHGICIHFIRGILRGIYHLHRHKIEFREASATSCILVPDKTCYGGFQVKIAMMKNFRQFEFHNPKYIEKDLEYGNL